MTDSLMDGAEPNYTPGVDSAGALLLHDLGGSPQVFASLAKVIGEAGFSVDVPLLPGHGTDIEDLVEMTWDDWAGASQLALDELASRTGPVVVVGIGMGATLACYIAAMNPEVSGVVAINARTVPVPHEAIAMLQAMLDDGVTYVPPLGPDVSDRTALVVGYDTVPVKTLISMFNAIEQMSDHWGDVKSPLLIVNSARDHRVSPYNAEFLAQHVGGTVERLTLERSFHMAPLDVESGDLETSTLNFANAVVKA